MAWFIKDLIWPHYRVILQKWMDSFESNGVKFSIITWKVWVLLSILYTFSFRLYIICWWFVKNCQVVDFRWTVVWIYFYRIDLSATSIILKIRKVKIFFDLQFDFRIFAVSKIQTRSVGLVRTIFTYIRAFNREYSCFDSELIRPQSALYS